MKKEGLAGQGLCATLTIWLPNESKEKLQGAVTGRTTWTASPCWM